MNVTWYSALNPDDGTEDLELRVDRFVASRSIALVLAGVPRAVDAPSLLPFGDGVLIVATANVPDQRDGFFPGPFPAC